jgi:hypothetical protein
MTAFSASALSEVRRKARWTKRTDYPCAKAADSSRVAAVAPKRSFAKTQAFGVSDRDRNPGEWSVRLLLERRAVAGSERKQRQCGCANRTECRRQQQQPGCLCDGEGLTPTSKPRPQSLNGLPEASNWSASPEGVRCCVAYACLCKLMEASTSRGSPSNLRISWTRASGSWLDR